MFMDEEGDIYNSGTHTLADLEWLPEEISKPEYHDMSDQAHIVASHRFASMLLQMREESQGGLVWLEGMCQLFRHGPEVARRRLGPLKELDELLSLVDDELFQFDGLAAHILAVNKAAQMSKVAQQYAQFSKVVEAEIMTATAGSCPSKEDANRNEWMTKCLKLLKADESSCVLTPGQLFVHLPLSMYVHNTLHLYQMLARLNSEAARGLSTSSGPAALRAVLDQGCQPYSWLVFAIMAALQILFRARTQLGVNPSSKSALGVLASNPDPEVDQDPFSVFEEPLDCGLMFRGLWVPSRIDESRARHQYAFNSWSRSLAGVLCVLNFYAKVLPVAKTPDWHVLLFVSHGWASNQWVAPVQLFSGTDNGKAEKELMVLPFVSFEFEDDLELTSEMSKDELRRRADLLVERWGLNPERAYGGVLSNEALGALQTAVGPELPKLLERSPGLLTTRVNDPPKHEVRGPRVTVRFVSHMKLRPAVRQLFEDESQLLFAFPPGEAVRDNH